ncbi:MAG: aldolase catalytic domain-containing protein [Deltaproteobacteria bacterium]|nr:aldolase catalytic domain-containing protein [Deltaproteobacteria bacterium]
MSHKISILDCTLRDGGYYNHWDYSPELVAFYLSAMGNARVDAIEIGFRLLDKKGFKGPYAYSTDEFLSKLSLPKAVLIGVMVNAKDLLVYESGPEAAVGKLFQPQNLSPIGLVRVAAHFQEVEQCGPLVRRLREKGYQVGFNLMQSGGRSREEIEKVARIISGWNAVDILYFADSLGNMNPSSMGEIVLALRSFWKGPIGFHAHDNMGLALQNCLVAAESGVEWLDGTILGMGRGAGNVRTEHLLIELQRKGLGDFYPDAVFPLALEHFEELRQKYGWGMNLLYYLSASYGIHPTYVQELLGGQSYEPHHLISALEFLKKEGGRSYSQSQMKRAVLKPQGASEGTWIATGWAKGRDFLLIAPGPGTTRYREAILQFIERTNPVVICLNANSSFPWEKVTAYAACHQARLLLDSEALCSLRKPLIAPLGAIPDPVQSKFSNVEILNYGLQVEEGVFRTSSTGCTIPSSLVAAYVMALAVSSGARRTLLAGFDGFGASDPRQAEMMHVLNCYPQIGREVPLLAVTPTSYPVTQSSVYAPDL